NALFDVNYDDITQPGTSQKIDAIGGVFMYRAQYRRWTGYNTILLNHAVIVNSTTKQTGIRWYELRQNTTTGVWSIYQEGTYAPDLHSRWMGSMAMDDNGSIGIAYAVSSGTVYPSIRYTGRLATDPLGQFTFAETTAATGTSSQMTHNRFGDYSQTSLDPDGITFWHTGEYLSSGGKTRIFSWQLPLSTTGVNDIENKPDLFVHQNENMLEVKAIRLLEANEVQVDLFDVMGKQIASKKLNTNNGNAECKLDVSGLAKATYLVRVGNEKFQKVVKVNIQ
ncbi:MAG TPA: T9SS type A sorting domain-containing protein, partial [Bacteroidia bacterium]|nr:T9SS type A sorting domain-containing protein [Bacteroidia bacterium]